MSNPFFASPPAETATEPEMFRDSLLGTRDHISGPQVPIETVAAPERPVLGRAPSGHRDPLLWVVGVHGGSGATSLSHAIPDALECERAWPMPPSPTLTPYVLLVARTHRSGIDAADNAVQEWASGAVPWLQLLGLVLIDDGPKVPPEVRPDLTRLLQSTPAGWHLGWMQPWRHLPLTERPVTGAEKRTIKNLTRAAHAARQGVSSHPKSPTTPTRKRDRNAS